MFTNLKNKLLDEVKASPAKFQQLAQAAQAAVSSTSSTTSTSDTITGSENFFSITEEDTPESSPLKINKNDKLKIIPNSIQLTANNAEMSPINNGMITLTNRSRKLSNSSMASDISFRLPSYESTAVYHLQSDLDISASEHEDSSPSSARLDLISKEQLHDAYRKALDRYQKYRSRYTDLAKRYRDLERDSTKARSVLVETQDKAIRRISELREQCTLEQQAKAHLEEALRIEMDDMQCKLKAYQTKFKLIGDNSNVAADLNNMKADQQQETLINLETETINPTELQNSKDLDKKVQELQLMLEEKLAEINVLNSTVENSEKVIATLKKQEEENAIILATNKLDIHSELEAKEMDIKKLKTKLLDLEHKFQNNEKEKHELQSQLSQINDLQVKLKQTIESKQELQAKVISHDHIIQKLKENLNDKHKTLETAEEKIKNLTLDYEKKLEEAKKQHNSMMTNQHNDDDKVKNDLNAQIKSLQDEITSKETELTDSNHQIQVLQSELNQLIVAGKSNDKEKFEKLEKTLKVCKEELKIAQKNFTDLQNEQRAIYDEKVESEKMELKEQIKNILKDIGDMDNEMKEVKLSHSQLEQEKCSLEKKIENMQQQNQQNQEGNQQQHWQETENKLREVETKLKLIESESTQMAEKNCLLEENSNRLKKLISEHELTHKKDKSTYNESIKKLDEQNNQLRLEYETATQDIQILNEKIRQVLDENSQLKNDKELMEHNHRSLEDKIEATEKEKLCVLDSNECLEKQIKEIQSTNKILNLENTRLSEMSNKLKYDFDTITKKLENNSQEAEKLKAELQIAENAAATFEKQLKSIQEKYAEDARKSTETSNECEKKLKAQLETLNQQFVDDLGKLEKSYEEKIANSETEMETLKTKITALLKESGAIKEENESYKIELETLNNQNQARLSELENLLKETNDQNQTLQQSVQNATDFEKKLQNYEQLEIENKYLNTLTNQLKTDIRKQKDNKQKADEEIKQLNIQIQTQQKELDIFAENQQKYLQELTEKSTNIDNLKVEIANLSAKIKQEIDKNLNDQNSMTQQNELIQKELLLYQTKLQEAETLCGDTRKSYEDVIQENIHLTTKLEAIQAKYVAEIHNLNEQILQSHNKIKEMTTDFQLKLQNSENIEQKNQELNQKIVRLEGEKLSIIKKSNEELGQHKNHTKNLQKFNEILQIELDNLKSTTSVEISNLQHEIENNLENIQQLTDKLMSFDELKQQAMQLTTELNQLKADDQHKTHNNNNNIDAVDALRQERDDSILKLDKIMHEVQDVSNRNLFLEQKCENYLILEQSNERLKLANQKLSRQLDETLISMQHSNDGIQANTEFEYLKNIMFQYLTGTVNGNNETLVKVIAAVLKFSPQQTQVAIEKEHQKNSLVLFKK